MTDTTAIKQVFEQRSMYDAVVRHDYMRHAEIALAIASWAKSFAKPLRVVDLGCGDGGVALSGFRFANIESYFGVDLAESSVERARECLSLWTGRVELECGNLAEALHRRPEQSANVVLASYALHHFTTDDKLKLIKDIGRVLESGGGFLWVDVVRNDNESRPEYIDRITSAMMQDWVGLTPDQRALGVDHVRQSDFPERNSWMLEQVTAAGFRLGATLFQDELFGGWAFTKR